MPSPAMLMAIAAIGGSLAVIGGLALAIARFACDQLDRRFDALKDQRREDMDRIDKRFDELAALIREALKART